MSFMCAREKKAADRRADEIVLDQGRCTTQRGEEKYHSNSEQNVVGDQCINGISEYCYSREREG